MKKVLGLMLCMVIFFSCFSYSSADTVVPSPNENVPKEYLQYFVKWDDELMPEDSSITETEYQTTFNMDKNENGIWDVLEEEEEEEDVVRAAAAETGIIGDLNGDMFVDNRDVVLMYRHVAGWDQDINTRVLDFNGDGYINVGDANHLMKYVSGWSNTILYQGKKYDIIYHVLNESMYQDTQINNTNQDYYYSSDGLSLKNITADGYIFEGWYDGEGSSAERIKKIDTGETGEIELYARWTPRTYKIDFDSSLVAIDSKYYTIETGTTLSYPSLSNYIFVGWTNQEDGRLVNGIPKGTHENLVLVANWASRRNLAKPVQNLGDPIIAEDTANGKILFIYKIGDIVNVPLFTLYRFSTAEGMSSSYTVTEQRSIGMADARTISQTVAQATTDSGTWTLSEGWNNNTSISQESLEQSGLSREEAEQIARSSTGTYRLDSSVTQSEVVVDSSQYAFKASGTDNHSHSGTDERGWKSGLTIDSSTEFGIGGVLGTPKVKETIDIGVSHEDNGKHSETTTDGWSNTLEASAQSNHSNTSSKSWNNSSSYSNSNTMSNSTTTSQQISELISNRYGYGQNYSQNGAHSSGRAFTTENTTQDSYSNTITYDTSTLYNKEITFSTDGKIDGYYRMVLAGTAHVFAVVGYDVATRSYFVYTFTVMDDDADEFLDYSKTTPEFNDNEIGVIPFEIPAFVNDYVNARIAKSAGLQININTGKVTGYTGEESVIVIPAYVDIDNNDGTYSSVKITGISAEAFKNNKTIQGIVFSDFITEIPDSSFEGCTALRDVYIPNLKKVGSRAFYGCTSLNKLTIPSDVTSLGNNAFYNVNAVEVVAANKAVALAAVNSGAKNLVLNIASINSEMKDAVLDVSSAMSSFEIRGERKQYENLRIKSGAATTTINGINFVNCKQVPMELYSSTVNLNQTTVSASGYCMVLAQNSCNLNLFGTNTMNSSGGSAIVCGTTTLANSDSSIEAHLQVSGNIYVYGSLKNQNQYLNQTSGNIIYITQEEFNQYISGVYTLKYDANGGSVSEAEKTGYSGVAVGTLPTPTRTGYTFAGWYTAVSGGTKVIESTSFTSSSTVTIYARWTPNTYQVTLNNQSATTTGSTSVTATYATAMPSITVPTKTGYTFSGYYTGQNGGGTQYYTAAGTSARNWNLTSSATLYAYWTVNKYTVTLNNQSATTAGTTSVSATYAAAMPSITIPTRNYYTFGGYYTAQNGGGTQYYTATGASARNWDLTSPTTLYAKWTLNPESSWVLESAVPSGAQITQTSWSYRESTESTSSAMSGWTANGSYWKQTGTGSRDYASFPSTYPTTFPSINYGNGNQPTYKSSMSDGAYTASNDGSTKREVNNVHGGWIYWHWMYSTYYASGTERTISDRSGTWNASGGTSGGNNYKYFYEIKSTEDCTYLDTYYCCSRGQKSYNCKALIPSNASSRNDNGIGTDRFFRIEYFTSTYTDSVMTYKYYRNVNYSATDPGNGSNISNKVKYVKYREK